MKSGPSKDKPLETRPCCVKCRRQMSRNRDTFRCLNCPRWGCKAHSSTKLDASNPYCLKCRVQMCKSNPNPEHKAFQCRGCWTTVAAASTYFGRVSVLPWCLECKQRMQRESAKEKKNDRKVDAFYCGRCKFHVAAQTEEIGRRSAYPCCVRCRVPMAPRGTTHGRRVFGCDLCNTYCVQRSTSYGRLRAEDFPADNPWCVADKFPLRETVLSGKQMFVCDRCGFLIAARATRYHQRPEGWKLRWILSLIDRHLPPRLPQDVREEASQALICDLLSGDLKQKNLNALTARRYVRCAHATRYADLSLDVVLPGGSRRIDLLVG
jgi:hypothetical protein